MDSIIIQKEDVSTFQLRVDEWNVIEPIEIMSGPDKGSFLLDADLLNREPKVSSLFPKNKPTTRKNLNPSVIDKPVAKIP